MVPQMSRRIRGRDRAGGRAVEFGAVKDLHGYEVGVGSESVLFPSHGSAKPCFRDEVWDMAMVFEVSERMWHSYGLETPLSF